MLTGTIKDIKNNYVYNVKAVDTSTTMQLTLTSSLQNALNHLLDEQFRNNDTDIDERRVDIQIASVVVQTEQYKDTATDKMKKTPVNSDFFCRLGALIRYAKTHCNTSTQTDYTGLTLASKEFEAVPDRKYKINFTDTAYAELSLSFGDITSLNLVTDDFEIKLDTNNREATPIFPRIKNGIKLGIKFDEEYLGFKVPEQIVETIEDVSEMYANIEEVIAAHPDKELKWLLGKNYIIVDDEHLEEICNYIADEKHEFVYYDTETTGLNITFKSRIGQADQLVGVVLSVKFGESYFFPTQMKSIPNLCGGDHFYFMEHYMRPILEGKKLVAHNMSFDWKVAYIYDINANIVHDTMALYKLTLGAEKKNFPMSLKETAKIILNRDSLELSDLIRNNSWGETDIKFWDLPYELVRLYACADTDNTMGLLLYAQESDLLGKYGANKTYEIEINFSLAVAYQEFYGHRLNLKNLSKIREDLGNEQADLMKKMEDIVGHSFNPNSPKQLQTVMYDELKIPKQIDRASGKVTTNKETLSNLAELTDIEGNTKYPFCKLLKEYREYEGVRKIVDKFPEHMTPDGYIFSSVMQYGTTTGRVSVNSPNYQSYNDPIKKNVIPREGFYMFDTDYSSVEYRVLGNMVGNKRIMKAFEDPDFDYHKYQAAHMYNVPYSAVTKKLRKAAKGINFGLPYGMGDESLGVRVFGEPSPENTRKAAALRAAYFKGQEDIRDWFEFHRNHGVNEGYTETYFGRRRYYYKQDFSEAKIRRQAGNQVIQGTAADIYKLAVGRVFKRVCREGWLGKILFTGFIHDELLGEVSNDINPAVFLKMLREEFEVKIKNTDGTPWCPLYMGFGYGMSWYEAKSTELSIKLQWEIVDKYGESGFPNWEGNGREFCDTVPDMIRDFEVRDISNQLLDADSQGKEIKATLNDQLLDCIKADAKYYQKGIKEYADDMGWNLDAMDEVSSWLYNNHDEIVADLDKKYHIQNLYKVDDNYQLEFTPSKSTQEVITQFCQLHNVDRTKINLLDIPDVDVTENNLDEATYISQGVDESELSEEKLQEIKDTRVRTWGMYLDVPNKEVILLMLPAEWLSILQSHTNKEGNGYNIIFKDYEKKMTYNTKAYITSQEVSFVQNLYLQYINRGN